MTRCALSLFVLVLLAGAGSMLIDEVADPHETKNLIDDPKFADVRKELAELAKKHAGGAK